MEAKEREKMESKRYSEVNIKIKLPVSHPDDPIQERANMMLIHHISIGGGPTGEITKGCYDDTLTWEVKRPKFIQEDADEPKLTEGKHRGGG